jgi:hypothetical protein
MSDKRPSPLDPVIVSAVCSLLSTLRHGEPPPDYPHQLGQIMEICYNNMLLPVTPSLSDHLLAITSLKKVLSLSPLEYQTEVQRLTQNTAKPVPTSFHHPTYRYASTSVASYPPPDTSYPPPSVVSHPPPNAVYQRHFQSTSAIRGYHATVSGVGPGRNYQSVLRRYPASVPGGYTGVVGGNVHQFPSWVPPAAPFPPSHIHATPPPRHHAPVTAVSFPTTRASPSNSASVLSDFSSSTKRSKKSQKGVKKSTWTNIPNSPRYETIAQLEESHAWSRPEAFGVYRFKSVSGMRWNTRKKQCAIEGCEYQVRACTGQTSSGSGWYLQKDLEHSKHVHPEDCPDDTWNSMTGLDPLIKSVIDGLVVKYRGNATPSNIVDDMQQMKDYEHSVLFSDPDVMHSFIAKLTNYLTNQNAKNKRPPFDETIAAIDPDYLIPPPDPRQRFNVMERSTDLVTLQADPGILPEKKSGIHFFSKNRQRVLYGKNGRA